MPSPVLATVTDPNGRAVTLSAERWSHILDAHPELGAFQTAVLQAVERPTKNLHGPDPGEEWCYLQGVGPSRWLKVVVIYGTGTGFIATAFARRRVP